MNEIDKINATQKKKMISLPLQNYRFSTFYLVPVSGQYLNKGKNLFITESFYYYC